MRAVLAMLLVGCGVDLATPTCAPGDPQTADWSSFGRGFTLARCQGCHASTAKDRRGAPRAVTFDSDDDAHALAPQIHAVVIDAKSMPPGGGVSDRDLALVSAWLSCEYGD